MLRLFSRRLQKLFEARDIVDKLVGITGLFITLGIALIGALILLLIFSDNRGEALRYFFLGPFLNVYSFGNMLNAAAPLMLAGLGIGLAFRASVFNLGGEGQTYAGAVAAVWICLSLPKAPGIAGILPALFGAAVLGAGIAGISGMLRAKWEVNELISSYLLSSGLVLVCDYLIGGPLRDPASSLQASESIARQFWLPPLLSPSHLNIGVLLALACLVGGYLFLFRSRWGYELRMCGYNREFSRYGGIHTFLYIAMPMAVSGGFHGLAGSLVALGTHHRSIVGFTTGLGWNAIAVALIAREHPLALLPAALFYAYLEAGAKAATIHTSVSLELVNLLQAVIFYLITAQGLFAFLRKRRIFLRRSTA